MENNPVALAAHLEEIANQFGSIDSEPSEGKYIGLDEAVEDALQHLITAMFPYHFGKARERFVESEKRTWELMRAYDALSRCFKIVSKCDHATKKYTMELIDALPEILEILKTDVQAGYEGDPAAMSVDEIILTYPAFRAIAIHRIAHKLYEMKVPLIPRVMSEYAHRITGIDIHPGAQIGKYFFIDHGTGVVIGETCVIGEHVKLYQHVTLGAKSFAVNDDGTLVKGIKRHPNLGNRVVVYSGATILGGNTYIGDDCVIGGNVWLTHSLEPGQVITHSSQEAKQRTV